MKKMPRNSLICLMMTMPLWFSTVAVEASPVIQLGKGIVKVVAKAVPELAYSSASRAMLDNIGKAGGASLRNAAERMAARHGERVLKVLGQSPKKIIPALERFSANDQAKLLHALQRKPRLHQAFNQFGDGVLKLELRSAGQAVNIIGTFGKDALALAGKLTNQQLKQLAVLAARFRNAPGKVIRDFFNVLKTHTAKVFDWLEKHPHVLYTATAAILVHDMRKELFGNPETGSHGVVQQGIDSVTSMFSSMMAGLAPWLACVLIIWLSFRSWLHRPRPPKKSRRRFFLFKRKQDDGNMIDAEVVNHG